MERSSMSLSLKAVSHAVSSGSAATLDRRSKVAGQSQAYHAHLPPSFGDTYTVSLANSSLTPSTSAVSLPSTTLGSSTSPMRRATWMVRRYLECNWYSLDSLYCTCRSMHSTSTDSDGKRSLARSRCSVSLASSLCSRLAPGSWQQALRPPSICPSSVKMFPSLSWRRSATTETTRSTLPCAFSMMVDLPFRISCLSLTSVPLRGILRCQEALIT
mmetsp:Transcript_119714/g.334153  ORF Transcript_119714/g.334153 Transcript_119714/m.334153 type:complete len:215 (+) Transcript_119714:202-846(+)